MSKKETCDILMFWHCRSCDNELDSRPFIKAVDYYRLEVGDTRYGFQVWCARHKCVVMSVKRGRDGFLVAAPPVT